MCALCKEYGTKPLNGTKLQRAIESASVLLKNAAPEHAEHISDFLGKITGEQDDEWDPERDAEWELAHRRQ